MNSIFNTEINYTVNKDLLLKLMKTSESTYIGERTIELAEKYEDLMKPKYIFKKLNIDSITDDTVTIGNEIFHSKVLATKLFGHSSVYIYIATSGKEIDEISKEFSDVLDYYIMDQISYSGYLCALDDMYKYMSDKYEINKFISLCAGSVPDWSVEEVIKIFNIFGENYKEIGVNVLESGLVEPLKSTSGILFATDETFHSCEICKKENCPSRYADFDEMLSLELLGTHDMKLFS